MSNSPDSKLEYCPATDQWRPRSRDIPGRAGAADRGGVESQESLLPLLDSAAGPPPVTPTERHAAIERESLRVLARILQHAGRDKEMAHKHADALVNDVLERLGMPMLANRLRELNSVWWYS